MLAYDYFCCLCTQDSSLVFALHCRQRHSEVFELIKERKLYSALVENLLPLMRLNMQVRTHSQTPAPLLLLLNTQWKY